MVFELNFKSGKPVYLQLVDQVRGAVASGAARAGDMLPSIRPLAEELRVNRNTIAKAYTELESQGVIETMRRQGLLPHRPAIAAPQGRPAQAPSQEIDDAVVAAHHLQVDRADVPRAWPTTASTLSRKRRARDASGLTPMTAPLPSSRSITWSAATGALDAVNGLSLTRASRVAVTASSAATAPARPRRSSAC